jgi:hypothetical protein
LSYIYLFLTFKKKKYFLLLLIFILFPFLAMIIQVKPDFIYPEKYHPVEGEVWSKNNRENFNKQNKK